jgi:hypothetical protein
MHRPLSLIIVSLLLAATAGAAEIPARKPGLWDMTLTLEGRNVAPVLMQQCVDAVTDRSLQSKLTNVKKRRVPSAMCKIAVTPSQWIPFANSALLPSRRTPWSLAVLTTPTPPGSTRSAKVVRPCRQGRRA